MPAENVEEAFPLQWPMGVPRAKFRENAPFSQTVASAQKGLLDELRRLGVTQAVISSDVGPRKRDGTLFASAKMHPSDPGVAVYFTLKGQRRCLACDKYFGIHNNMHAIAKTIEALRGIERWGTADMLDRAFQGFAALPAPTVAENWWDVLQVQRDASEEVVRSSYRSLARAAHPDRGGSHEAMSRLNVAMESFEAERELR